MNCRVPIKARPAYTNVNREQSAEDIIYNSILTSAINTKYCYRYPLKCMNRAELLTPPRQNPNQTMFSRNFPTSYDNFILKDYIGF